MTTKTPLATIQDFLAQPRLALVGLSRDPGHFSHTVLKELEARGIEVVAIHPSATQIAGRTCWPRLGEETGPVGGALIMTPALKSAGAVAEALAAGVPRIWLYRAGGKGAVTEEAIELCHEAGVPVVVGECPLMYLDKAAWFHKLHAWGKHVAGSYPT